MPKFYFPTLFLTPTGDMPERSNVSVVKRQWQTSTFDLATLQTRHKLHLSYTLIDVFLSSCNCEIVVEAISREDAVVKLTSFRLASAAAGAGSCLAPFCATHSVNQYSGINSRDSEIQRKQLPEGLRDGITSETATVEAWPVELSLHMLGQATVPYTSEMFDQAISLLNPWEKLTSSNATLRTFENSLVQAPLLRTRAQAILHVWTALESLFPSVTQEVSFKIALFLATLHTEPGERRKSYERARAAYKVRSKIAHGAKSDASQQEWAETWDVAMATVRALVHRTSLPSEEDLIESLIPANEPTRMSP